MTPTKHRETTAKPGSKAKAETDVHEMSAREIVASYDYLLDDATPLTAIDAETAPVLTGRVHELATYMTRAYAMEAIELFLCREEPYRFTELKSALGIPSKTLATRLDELVSMGLLTREQFDEQPPRVEYELTECLEELRPVFQFLFAWTERHDLEPASQSPNDE